MTLLMFPVAVFTSGPLRIVLGFVFVIFSPGYALLSVLLPKQGALSTIERVTLSFGSSIALVALIGIILSFTPWGIRMDPILISIAAFILLCSLIGYIRQQLLPEQIRLAILFKLDWSKWNAMSRVQKGISAAGLIILITVLGWVIYSAVSLPPVQSPNEFYILNSQGKAENYPRLIKAGESFSITAVIVNHESKPTNTIIKISNDGTVIQEIDTNVLQPEEKWEGKATSTLSGTGQNQKMDYYLYKDGDQEPYFKKPLYLYIDVIEK
jgi:uncharacterized membrane protein